MCKMPFEFWPQLLFPSFWQREETHVNEESDGDIIMKSMECSEQSGEDGVGELATPDGEYGSEEDYDEDEEETDWDGEDEDEEEEVAEDVSMD